MRPVKLLVAVVALFALALPRSWAAEDAAHIGIHRPLTSTSMILVGNKQGSGWVVDQAGKLLVTNRHVVDTANEVEAIFPVYESGQARVDRPFYLREAKRIKGKVLHRDSQRDLAVIELESLPNGALELKLATTSAAKGDLVHTSGNPGSETKCFVYSAGNVREVNTAKIEYDNKQKVAARVAAVNTDKQLGPGVSGGPVINAGGELVGVMAAGPAQGGKIVLCIDVTEVRAFLGEAYRQQATAAIGKKQYEKAIAYCDKAIDLKTDDALARNERGVAFSYQERYERAIKEYSTALKLDPKMPRAFRNRGSAHFHLGKYDEAVADCSEALKLDPNYALAYWYRGRALDKLNKPKEAEADLKKARHLDSALR